VGSVYFRSSYVPSFRVYVFSLYLLCQIPPWVFHLPLVDMFPPPVEFFIGPHIISEPVASQQFSTPDG